MKYVNEVARVVSTRARTGLQNQIDQSSVIRREVMTLSVQGPGIHWRRAMLEVVTVVEAGREGTLVWGPQEWRIRAPVPCLGPHPPHPVQTNRRGAGELK